MTFADFWGTLLIGWIMIYLTYALVGGINSIFYRGVREDNDISVKIRRIK
jgi:cbb3-type cytochrome oxidase subunit 3